MKRLIILITLALELVIFPTSAFTEQINWADKFIIPENSLTGGGFLGGDGDRTNPNQWIDWSIGNYVPGSSSLADDMIFSTNVGDFMNPADWNERMRINKDGKVGIGTTSPYQKLTVNGTIGFKDGTGPLLMNSETCCNAGNRMLWAHSPGYSDWGIYYDDSVDKMHWRQALGTEIMTVDFSNREVLIIGQGIPYDRSLSVIGGDIFADGGDFVAGNGGGILVSGGGKIEIMDAIGNGPIMSMDPNPPYTSYFMGNVGIDTKNPADILHVAGDIRVGTGNIGCVKDADGTVIAGTCASDSRMKSDIEPFSNVLDKLVQVQPVHFRWKTEEFPEYRFGTSTSFGLVAQQVEQIMPELVAEDEKGYKAIRYSKLPLLLLQAMKEQQDQIRRLQEEIEGLRGKLNKKI